MLMTSLFYLFIIIGSVNLLHFALYIIGANFYDASAFKAFRRKKQTPSAKPLVSVLIPAYNEERVVERCLKSVWNSTYENIEIIVVSDGSTDATSEVVRRFTKTNSLVYLATRAQVVRQPDGSFIRIWNRGKLGIFRRIKLVEQRNTGKATALNKGLRFYATSELVMTLDADSMLHPKAIANAVRYFDDPKIVGVAANVRLIEEPTILGMLQRYEHMLSYRSKKFFTVTNCELIVGGVASTYRRSALERVGCYDTDTATEDIGLSMKIVANGNKENKLIYAADVAAMTEGVNNFGGLLRQRYRWKLGNLQNAYKYRHLTFALSSEYSKMLTWYRMPMTFLGEVLMLLEPIVFVYVTYLSLRYLTAGLFISAYATITVYILLTIWPDEYLANRAKIKASFYAPLLYFIFYIMNIVQIISVILCIRNFKQITNLSTTKSTWVSPQRDGRVATFS